MSKIYLEQSALRIKLTAGVDITGALEKEIRYRKPNGTEGAWTAEESVAATGVIYYDLTGTELDAAGIWKFWAYIKFSDSRSAVGEAVQQQVYIEGE